MHQEDRRAGEAAWGVGGDKKGLRGEQTPNWNVKDKGKIDTGAGEGEHQRLGAVYVKR